MNLINLSNKEGLMAKRIRQNQLRINRVNSEDGFTLIELLIVVLIIGVLSAIVVVAVSNSTGDAKAKACTQNATNLLSAMENYKATSQSLGGGEGAYPTSTAAATPVASPAPTINGSTLPVGAIFVAKDGADKLSPGFIKTIPSPYASTSSGAGYGLWVTASTNGTAFVTTNGVVDGCKNAGI